MNNVWKAGSGLDSYFQLILEANVGRLVIMRGGTTACGGRGGYGRYLLEYPLLIISGVS